MDLQTLLGMYGGVQGQSELDRLGNIAQSTGDVSEQAGTLKGPGGPFDDQIQAVIKGPNGEQEPAELSPEEFVVNVPTVADLGLGDTDVGGMLLDILQENPDARAEVRGVLAKYLK